MIASTRQPVSAQVTLSDLYADRALTEAQARRIVALFGLAGGARRAEQDAGGPEAECHQLGASSQDETAA